MSRYSTGNGRPSTSMKDVSDNAQVFDDVINLGNTETTTDRFGNKLPSLRKQVYDLTVSALSNIKWQEVGDWSAGLVLDNYAQVIRYDNTWYRYTGTLEHTISGDSPENDGGVWSSDNTAGVWVNIGDTAVRQNLAEDAGFGMIGQCNDYAALREVAPEYSGQKIKVRSSVLSWSDTENSLPGSSIEFIYLDWMSVTDFPDDGGTLIAAADGKSVWLNTAIINSRVIDVRWFGATNDYVTDSTTAIQSAMTAAAFWADNSYHTSRGFVAHRYQVVFPQKWFASGTITYNPVLVELDFNGCIGMFLSSGTYDTHPLDSSYPMLFYMRCETPDSDLFVPAYGSFPLGKNGTCLFGTISNGYPDSSCYNTLPTTDHVMFCHHGVSETIYTALGQFDNVAVCGAGRTYMNGDYAWGTNFFGCKWINNKFMMRLIAGKDNGEKIECHGCFSGNNGGGIEPAGWGGKINYFGGSLDYFRNENPFNWDSDINGLWLNIMGTHIEFNPYATKNFFKLANGLQKSRLSLSQILYVLADPEDGGGVINDSFITRNPSYPEALTIDGFSMEDASASATYTQNYLLVNDDGLPLNAKNINPITLKDYLVMQSFLNRKRTGYWQYYFSGSDAFTVTATDTTVSIVGTADAAVGDKSVYLFIPAQDTSSQYQFIMSLLTCTRMDVATSFAVYSGFSTATNAGLIDGSYVQSDQSIGTEHLVNMKVGKNTNVDSYAGGASGGGYDTAGYSRPILGKPAEGMLVRIWLYNFVEGSTLTLTSQSGLITF